MDETERIPAVLEMEVSKEEKHQHLEDELEKKPTAADVAAFASACIVQPQLQPQPHLQKQPDIPMSLDVTEAQESSIYAQTWSLEYRKLSEDQKFYAKRAIDEIFVLGRLRRLKLNTVPPAE
ncbi:GL15680 [Drosophila persimilis]|uniref:GL15680 n=2 Tax=pseudoobscura subgroup TaxID=32358 RepID=B4H918_DROPE|nr:GL15680 [Drosophila persimilis]